MVFIQPAIALKPSEGSFDYPSLRKRIESAPSGRTILSTESIAIAARPAGFVAGVGKDRPQARHLSEELPKKTRRLLAVIFVGSMNDHAQKESERIDDDVALTPADLFARITSAFRPPCRAISTDWVSITAALGLGLRPEATRAESGRRGARGGRCRASG